MFTRSSGEGRDGRGVEVFLLHPEPGCETFKRVFEKAMTVIQGVKKAWASEVAPYN
jgi:hypothetical protein